MSLLLDSNSLLWWLAEIRLSHELLARLDTVDPGTVKSFLERRWRQCAPKKALKDWEAARPG